MAYCNPNFKTLKALREAVARGDVVTVFSPGPFGCNANGKEFLEGPHYPEPHRWYRGVTVKDGRVVAVDK